MNQANWKLSELTRQYGEIPALPDEADRVYAVPPSGPVRIEYRGLPLASFCREMDPFSLTARSQPPGSFHPY